MKEYAVLCRRSEYKKNLELIYTIYHASRDKKFPVAFCNPDDLEVSAMVERVLNSYAKQGWRLVSTTSRGGGLNELDLYLERDV